jgi:hypothetical protein
MIEGAPTVRHEHQLEFHYATPDSTWFRCIIEGCDHELQEPEDAGTGA